MNITEYLTNIGFNQFEGYSQQCPEQVNDLIEIVKKYNIKNIMEIGFNAGHSAEVFLQIDPEINLVSFDIGIHNYVKHAKEFIDNKYPNRHTLILGDSLVSLHKYFTDTKITSLKKFDLIFIDGGHDYNIAKSDLFNCKNFAKKNTIVIMDDTTYTNGWIARFNIGPSRSWIEGINEHLISEINRKEYKPYRGMSWGKYILKYI